MVNKQSMVLALMEFIVCGEQRKASVRKIPCRVMSAGVGGVLGALGAWLEG